jgi:hypothetical protein
VPYVKRRAVRKKAEEVELVRLVCITVRTRS